MCDSDGYKDLVKCKLYMAVKWCGRSASPYQQLVAIDHTVLGCGSLSLFNN